MAASDNDVKAVSYFHLFRFADKLDIFVLVLGVVCSIINGATLPAFSVLFGNLLNEVNKDSSFINAV